ncbi:hypothetical protein CF54_36080 [Streptomyces sp. Tu 6176]|nr:hypothetical protein CF54_36080 [Streptomyces sp. Tu 6176]
METLHTRWRLPGGAVSRMRTRRPAALAKAARPMSSPHAAQGPSRARRVEAYSQVAWRTASSTRAGTSSVRGRPS